MRLKPVARGGTYDDFAAAHSLADVIIGLASEHQSDAWRQKGTKALSRTAFQKKFKRALGQTLLSPLITDFPGDLCPHGAVGVVHLVLEADGLLVGNRVLRILKNGVVQGSLVHRVVATASAVTRLGWVCGCNIDQKSREVERVGFRMIRNDALFQELGAPNDILERTYAEAREDFPHFFRNPIEEGHEHVRRAFELGAQPLVLTGDSHGTRVQVALPDVHATERNQRRGSKVELLSAENRRAYNVDARTHPAIGAKDDPIA